MCIFDLDGTLVDTLDSILYTVEKTLERMGLPKISRKECRAFVGNGAKVLMSKALESAQTGASKEIEQGMEIYGEFFEEFCTYRLQVYQGIWELLETLRKKEVLLAVLTNKPEPQAKKVMTTLFGEDIFFRVWGQNSTRPRKPNPQGVFLLMEEGNVEIEECLFVGDSEVDFETGERAGVDTLIATWGFRSREELIESGVKCLIDSPKEIEEYFL